MIKINIMYPYSESGTFDMNYYLDKHMGLCKNLLGYALKSYTVDVGTVGIQPGPTPAYTVMVNLFFDLPLQETIELFSKNTPAFIADIPKFTNIQPQLQVNESKY